MNIESATFETIRRLLSAEQMSDLNCAFTDFARPFGTDSWTSVQLSSGFGIEPVLPREFGDPPCAWQARYREERYALDDLAVLQVIRSDAPFFLSDLLGVLGISVRTVETLMCEARERMGVPTTAALVAAVLRRATPPQ